MDTVLKRENVVPALHIDDLAGAAKRRRQRRLVRATEAFRKRSEASESRWLAGLGGVKLRGERYGARPSERAGELDEDRQVGVKPDPLKPTDAER